VVSHEESVEATAHERLGEADLVREVEVGVREGAWVSPPGDVDFYRAA